MFIYTLYNLWCTVLDGSINHTDYYTDYGMKVYIYFFYFDKGGVTKTETISMGLTPPPKKKNIYISLHFFLHFSLPCC